MPALNSRPSRRSDIDWLRVLAVLLLIPYHTAPLALAEILPDIGGKNPFWYFSIFMLGVILAADERFQQSINRHRAVTLALGLMTMAIAFNPTRWLFGMKPPQRVAAAPAPSTAG